MDRSNEIYKRSLQSRRLYNFEWDEANKQHIQKHSVKPSECEESFFDENKKIYKDLLHSQHEKRYILLGRTQKERLLYIVFTLRGEKSEKVRVVSARDINKRELQLYNSEA